MIVSKNMKIMQKLLTSIKAMADETRLRILALLYNGEMNNLNFVPVTRKSIQRVRITLRDINLNALPATSEPVYCTLLLKPI